MPTRHLARATIVKDRILVAATDVWKIQDNPTIRSVERVEPAGHGRVLVHVTRAIAPAPRSPRRMPFRLEVHVPDQLKRALLVLAGFVGVIAVLLGAGALVYSLYGDTIDAAFKRVAVGVGAFLALMLIAWVTSLMTGRCPGLHCPGCGHK
jgi:hypothetical protein